MSPNIPFKEDGDLLLGPSMIKRWAYAVSKLYGEKLAMPTIKMKVFHSNTQVFWRI